MGNAVEVVELKTLSDEDMDYMSDWIAKAFSTRDAWNVWLAGVLYRQDPALHKLLCRFVMERGSRCGTIVTTSERLGFRLIFKSTEKNRVFDSTWRSGQDTAFDAFIARIGGKDVFDERVKACSGQHEEQLQEVVKQAGGSPCYTSAFFAVHPEHHNEGIGSAINNYFVRRATEDGCKLYFGTNLHNLPMYEHIGCKRVGQTWKCGYEVPDGYPPESGRSQLVLAGARSTN